MATIQMIRPNCSVWQLGSQEWLIKHAVFLGVLPSMAERSSKPKI